MISELLGRSAPRLRESRVWAPPSPAAHRNVEEFRGSGTGGVSWRRRQSTDYDPEHDYQYFAGEQVKKITSRQPPNPVPPGFHHDTTYNKYDLAGNVRHNGWRMDYETVSWGRANTSFYGADQKLMAHQLESDSAVQNRRGAFEEYWYQLLAEVRHTGATGANLDQTPNAGGTPYQQYGRVIYTHGPGVDAPLDVIRLDYNGTTKLLRPHANWRGTYDAATDSTGAQFGCTPIWYSGCPDMGWTTEYRSYLDGPQVIAAPEWFGSLLRDQRDLSGLMYMRNRYYDPNTGQFTQQDPIGLAGGLNLYGFANGDPINFSDPFGLCPPGDIACSWLEAGFTALGSVAGFVIGGGGGTLVAALTGGLGTAAIPAGAWQGAALGAAAGLAVGKFFSSSQGSSSSEGGSSGPRYKESASGRSGAEAARDVPSWAQGNRPMVGESGKDFAKRLLDQKYGPGEWRGTGPGSEYSKIKKWGDRGFVDPK